MKSASRDFDLVKVYLNQMSQIPPISAEEEQVLAKDLEETRNDLRHGITLCGTGIDRTLRTIEELIKGRQPVDRVLLVEMKEGDTKETLVARILKVLPRAKRLVSQNRKAFRLLLIEKNSTTRAKMRKEIKKRVAQAVEFISPFPLQINKVLPMVDDIYDTLREVQNLKKEIRYLKKTKGDPARIRSLEQKAVDLQVSAQESPRGLNACLDRIDALKQKYENAKKRLSQKNLRLVVSIAKKFRNKGLPLLDLIQEGNTGLMKALDRYQASRGNKFSTYATWWIKQTITRSIAYQSRTIRIPIHAINNLNRLIEEKEDFMKAMGREPSLEEIAERAQLPAKEVSRLMEINKGSLSIDQPFGSGEDTIFGDILEDSRTETPLQLSQRNLLKDNVRKILQTLSYREREVLKLRYGLGDGSTYTLEEVGSVFKVSRERIRQIEAEALRKLQFSQRSRLLKGFWEDHFQN